MRSCSFLFALGACALFAASGEEAAEDRLATGLAELRSLPPGENELAASVPEEAKRLLTEIKSGLREVVVNVLASTAPDVSDLDEIRFRIVRQLEARGVIVGEEDFPDDRGSGYGYVRHLELIRFATAPNLLGVTTRLSIACGSDTSLYLFRRDGERWTLVLADETPPYDEISGAREGFEYQVPKGVDRDGDRVTEVTSPATP